MLKHLFLGFCATSVLLAGCGHAPKPANAAVRARPWQTVIDAGDRKRLVTLYGAWTRSLADVQRGGQMPAVTALGDLAVPDAGRAAPPPAPGGYRCRSVKLGNREDGSVRNPTPAVIASPFRRCAILANDGLLYFDQGPGGQRVAGNLYPDGGRMVFLGSMALVGESGTMSYGADDDRDQVGILQAIGDRRWRLELPWPKWQSNMEIIEIVPA